MADAKRDSNYITTLLAVSNADGTTPVLLYADPTTHRLLTSAASVGTGGSDTQVQFNDGGVLGGDAGFVYNKTTNVATLDVIQLTNTGLKVLDTDASHYLTIVPGSNLTAARNFTITTGDAARTLTLAGDLNIAANFTTSGAFAVTITATGITSLTLPTSGTLATTSNKLSDFAATTSLELKNTISDETGSGALVFANTPTLVTPVLGAATATSINGLTITTSTGTLTITNGKTLSVSNTLTFTGTDASSVAFGAGGTVAYVANNLSVFAATTSLQLLGVISDETGSGALVFANTPTLVTPVLGAATATSINGLTITTSTGTLTITNGKTLSASNTLTFAGTDGNTFTFPSGSDTVVVLAATQTLTNKRITQRVVSMADATTITPTADTADENTHVNTQATGTLTVAAPSGTPTDGQKLVVRIKSTNVQTFSWNAIYRGSTDLALPTVSTASSKTDYMAFIYNSADSKWDLVAKVYGYT